VERHIYQGVNVLRIQFLKSHPLVATRCADTPQYETTNLRQRIGISKPRGVKFTLFNIFYEIKTGFCRIFRQKGGFWSFSGGF